MYSMRLILLLGVAIASSQSLIGYAEVLHDESGSKTDLATLMATDTELAVNFVTADNIKMQFPYFEPLRHEIIDADLNRELVEIGKEVMEYLDQLIIKMLSSPKKPSTRDWMRVGKHLNGIMKKVPKEGLAIAKHSGYDRFTLGVIERLMAGARKVQETMEYDQIEKDPENLVQELHKPLFGIVKAFEISKAGVFAAWGNGLINNQPAEAYAADLMGKLRYHGYGKLLTLAEVALKGLLAFNRLKDKFHGRHEYVEYFDHVDHSDYVSHIDHA